MVKKKETEVEKLVREAEEEVRGESLAEKKEKLKQVVRDIKEAEQVVRRLEAKKKRLIEDIEL